MENVMKNRWLTLIFVIASLTGSLNLFGLCGFDRLYNPYNNTIIDLLSDSHARQDALSSDDMHELPFYEIEQLLYPTERRFLQALRVLNTQNYPSVAVVWVQDAYDNADDQFIGFSGKLVQDRFEKLKFYGSDQCRAFFWGLMCKKPQGRTLERSVYGVSFKDPMPLPYERRVKIFQNSGEKAWDAYEKLRKDTIAAIHTLYGEDYLCGKEFKRKDFKDVDAVDSLTDSEMLSYILASGEKHIIVVAGGWHINNIYDFLTEKIGCELQHSSKTLHGSVPLKDFDLIEENFSG